MNFASDNIAGASPQVLEAIIAANAGREPSYGADRHTARAEALLREVFETDLALFTVATGTAERTRSGKRVAQSSACMPPIEPPMTQKSVPMPRWSSSSAWARTISPTVMKGKASP